jgi:hypothetical protein
MTHPQSEPWPRLPLEEWEKTSATLHRWTQIRGPSGVGPGQAGVVRGSAAEAQVNGHPAGTDVAISQRKRRLSR